MSRFIDDRGSRVIHPQWMFKHLWYRLKKLPREYTLQLMYIGHGVSSDFDFVRGINNISILMLIRDCLHIASSNRPPDGVRFTRDIIKHFMENVNNWDFRVKL